MSFCKNQIKSLNETVHHILKNEIDLILPQFPTNRKEKRSIFILIITGFIELVNEGISSLLHNRRHKAVKAMKTKTNIQCNKLMHLENTMAMYGIYNAETLEKLIKQVHGLHKIKTF